MLRIVKRAVIVSAFLWVMVAWGFTFLLLGLAQLLFPFQANGSVVQFHGHPVASAHVGQNFATSLRYFWGRPSATVSPTTGKPDPYDALNSGPSNLGPTNAALLQQIQAAVARYLATTPGLRVHEIPISLVESSGSGLDPDITLQSALIQIPRVAKYTGISPHVLRRLVYQAARGPELGLFGVERVNVVQLNVSLAKLLRHS
ncbi:MAG: K(+)-transporting ATPase subunit C [Firmicutes bacterium]|nr:K(+)-transporting ATPase subunit C [Bacillota bacterium]